MSRQFNIPIRANSNKQRIQLFMEVLYKFHNLSDGLIQLVVELVDNYYEIQGRFTVPQEDGTIFSIMFNTDNRERLAEKLGMSRSVFDTSLSKLRAKGVLTKDNVINPNYLVPKDEFDLNFKFYV